MLLWVCIHTGQAEKFAWPILQIYNFLLSFYVFQPANTLIKKVANCIN
jgi:hypothetical protein